MVAIVPAAKRNVKKTDEIDIFVPALPKGKVKVIIQARNENVLYYYRYSLLEISPVINDEFYLYSMIIDGAVVTPTPLLFLDELISEVRLSYVSDSFGLFGGVVQQFYDVELKDIIPQLLPSLGYYSLPQMCVYKGVTLDGGKLDIIAAACPVDLDTTDFEVWRNGIKFTLSLNRSTTLIAGHYTVALFDIIKAEFYGKLLPAKYVDDYVELKPKGD